MEASGVELITKRIDEIGNKCVMRVVSNQVSHCGCN